MNSNTIYTKPLIIMDIDGTICDPSHRMFHLDNNPVTSDAWKCFLDGACDDPVIEQGLALYNAFRDKVIPDKDFEGEVFLTPQYLIGFVTSRNEAMRELTETWLFQKKFAGYDFLLMRKEGDHRKDYIVKEEILIEQIIPKYGKPFMVVEDNHDVIRDCWKKNGCYVIDISQGVNTFAVKGPNET